MGVSNVSHIVINLTVATEDSGAREIGTQIVKELLKNRDVLNADLDVILPGKDPEWEAHAERKQRERNDQPDFGMPG